MNNDNSIAIFSEIIAIDQRVRARLAKALPKGMELSHFSVLNHLASTQGECTPAQLAKALHVSRGAMTNTLAKLEMRGDIHIRPDWDDARQKYISLSNAGRQRRDEALRSAHPLFANALEIPQEDGKKLLQTLRTLRLGLEDENASPKKSASES